MKVLISQRISLIRKHLGKNVNLSVRKKVLELLSEYDELENDKRFCLCKNRSMQTLVGNTMYCIDCELPVKN